jgi:hypothetical protein
MFWKVLGLVVTILFIVVNVGRSLRVARFTEDPSFSAMAIVGMGVFFLGLVIYLFVRDLRKTQASSRSAKRFPLTRETELMNIAREKQGLPPQDNMGSPIERLIPTITDIVVSSPIAKNDRTETSPLEGRLERLADLHKRGLISTEVLNEKQRDLLKDL